MFLPGFGRRDGATAFDGDVNSDGRVGLHDLAILQRHFGERLPSSPEPSAPVSSAPASSAVRATVAPLFAGTSPTPLGQRIAARPAKPLALRAAAVDRVLTEIATRTPSPLSVLRARRPPQLANRLTEKNARIS
jgi:hypothetical protein